MPNIRTIKTTQEAKTTTFSSYSSSFPMQPMHLSAETPTSLKTMFALRFLRAYSKINRYKSPSCLSSSSSSSSIVRRCKRIKLAAYASMARAVGPKRAWSRALLHKVLHRTRLHQSVTRPKVSGAGNGVAGGAINRTDKLRRLVPGGERMDFCSLLGETANYIQCLTAQVHVMEGIADSLPPQAWF
ncbi:hypothetical protein MRB53_027743 [Persea americana]|uniref:Uncharacterized protein n=1 Tax=Persea americana TaxID=3435 RepID=A0ACC2LLR3_PERAE|nr:hypothetical protein MRB53_027743 [Persea americana]|eukprot:TRINITY_DN11376_c0_g1_i1.p1 TRINITY_DN11376_c0_g1~~TRINITY_DN11376_c0_g1_i1.p1  ORF type:complete len:186 (+),score=28.64 TRINITY_DN11376_c0_g1_i1:407-964(+)